MVEFEWMTYEAAANDPRLHEMLRQAIQQSDATPKRSLPSWSPRISVRKDVSSFDKIVDLITAIDIAYVVRTLLNVFDWGYDD